MILRREDLIKEMKESIGTKDPVVFFDKMVDIFSLLFDRLDRLELDNSRLQVYSALAIQWEPKVAADMLSKQIEILRQDKDTYFLELSAFKRAYTEDNVTQNYNEFCNFWVEILGWHPFLDYK